MKNFCRKYWYVLLAVTVFIMWAPLRGLARRRDLDSQSDIVDGAAKKLKDSEPRTLSDYELVAIANKIEVDLMSDWSEDESDAIAQVMKCKNTADWYALVSEFGTRKPWGVFREAIALPTALKRYLDAEDYAMVQNYINGIGGVL